MSVIAFTPDARNKYVDLSLYNPSNVPIIQKFKRKYTDNLLENAEDYRMSIVKFYIDARSFPLRIVETTGVDADTMKETITVSYLGNTDTQNFSWIPQNSSLSAPTTFSPQQVTNGYYYLYTPDHYVGILNNALEVAFTNVQTASAPALNTCNKPYFKYNRDTKKLSLIADSNFFDLGGTPANPVTITCNRFLAEILGGFHFDFINTNSDNYALFIVGNTGNNLIEPASTASALVIPPANVTNNFYVMEQDVSFVPNLNSLKTIVLTSELLPSASESVDEGLVFGEVTNANNNEEVDNVQSIVTDFTVPDEIVQQNPRYYEYLPTAQYRYISLLGSNSKIEGIDIDINVRDQYGVVRPLYLVPGGSSSMKILFEKYK